MEADNKSIVADKAGVVCTTSSYISQLSYKNKAPFFSYPLDYLVLFILGAIKSCHSINKSRPGLTPEFSRPICEPDAKK